MPGDADHPFADIDLLLIVHPVKINRPQSPQPGMPPMGNTTLELISTDTQYAIDQYLVNGGKAIAFIDNQHFVSRFFDIYSSPLPFAPQDRHPQWYKDLYNLFTTSGWEHYRSGLDDLTAAWGVGLGTKEEKDGRLVDVEPLLYDPQYSRPVTFERPVNQMIQREFRLSRLLSQIPSRRDQQMITQPLFRGNGLMAKFEKESLTDNHPVTRDLSSSRWSTRLPSSASPRGVEDAMSTSNRAKAVPGDTARMLLELRTGRDHLQFPVRWDQAGPLPGIGHLEGNPPTRRTPRSGP